MRRSLRVFVGAVALALAAIGTVAAVGTAVHSWQFEEASRTGRLRLPERQAA